MAFLITHAVHALRVLAVHGLERSMQSCDVRRNCYKVYVIRHQAVRHDIDSELRGVLGKQVKKGRVVARTKKYAFAAITALRDMVGHVGEDNTCVSWHARML